jgi:glucans biosynthesis protein
VGGAVLAQLKVGAGFGIEVVPVDASTLPMVISVSTTGSERELARSAGFKLVTSDPNTEQRDLLLVSADGQICRGDGLGVAAYPFAIYSADAKVEERPRFDRCLLTPLPDVGLSIDAVLTGETVDGILQLEVVDASTEAISVRASLTLQFRSDVEAIGIAPVESMFLFAAGNRSGFDDYRQGVHESDGLWIRGDDARVSWRSLNNPPHLANSYFAHEKPPSFALVQRARDFAAYQDATAHFEQRPSLTVVPQHSWSQGFVRLIEIPSRDERERNIVAFWMPGQRFTAGEQATFHYQLHWAASSAESSGQLGAVTRLSTGQGGFAGVENTLPLRKFVVDFTGFALGEDALPEGPVDAFVSVTPGHAEHIALFRLPGQNTFRLVIDAQIETADPVEMRAYLMAGGRQVTETWLYQWRAG